MGDFERKAGVGEYCPWRSIQRENAKMLVRGDQYPGGGEISLRKCTLGDFGGGGKKKQRIMQNKKNRLDRIWTTNKDDSISHSRKS